MAARKLKKVSKVKNISMAPKTGKQKTKNIYYLKNLEQHANWKAIGITTVFNLAAVVASFLIFFTNLGKLSGGLYYSLIVLGLSVTISVLAWVTWTFREVEEKRIAAIISFSILITLVAMLMIIWQTVSILGTLL